MNYGRAKIFALIAFTIGFAVFFVNPKFGFYYALGGLIFLSISAQIIKVLHNIGPQAQSVFPTLGFDGKISEREAIPLLIGVAMSLSPIIAALCVVLLNLGK